MGMDIYGRRPSSIAGEYYRGQWDDWHRLADCICALAPAEAGGCKDWYSNDGDGLDAAESQALADKLDNYIINGTAGRYINEYNAKSETPRKLCCLCAMDLFVFVQRTEGAEKLAMIGGGEQGACDECGAATKVKTSYNSRTSMHINDLREFPWPNRLQGSSPGRR